MWFHVDPQGGVPIYMQVIAQVKRAVATGVFKEGDQLPSVRELAMELTVNPNTIGKAYQELERDGIINSVKGKGSFIAGREVRIMPEERQKLLILAIDKALIEAHHLGFSEEEVHRIFENRIGEWKVNQQ